MSKKRTATTTATATEEEKTPFPRVLTRDVLLRVQEVVVERGLLPGRGSKIKRKRKRGRRGEVRGRRRKRQGARKENNFKTSLDDSPLDSLLLVSLGVGEALDGARLAPEEAAEVGPLVFGFEESEEGGRTR